MMYIERAPAWLRWGGSAFLVRIALLLAVLGGLESAWGLYVAAITLVTGAMWWCFLARIAVTVEGGLRYRIVLADRPSAERLAETITA